MCSFSYFLFRNLSLNKTLFVERETDLITACTMVQVVV